jgi:hypothetical protein
VSDSKDTEEFEIRTLGLKLEFTPEAPQMPETATERVAGVPRAYGGNHCLHIRTGAIVDGDRHLVLCGRCKAILDPFLVLSRMSREHDAIRRDFAEGKKEAQQTRLRIEVLKRLEKNVRERLKRLGIKADDGHFQRNLTAVLKEIVADVRREEG